MFDIRCSIFLVRYSLPILGPNEEKAFYNTSVSFISWARNFSRMVVVERPGSRKKNADKECIATCKVLAHRSGICHADPCPPRKSRSMETAD